jgi:hypothetical protein
MVIGSLMMTEIKSERKDVMVRMEKTEKMALLRN